MDDPRPHGPRTGVLLADPRLAEASRVLGRTLVKSVVAQAQQQACDGAIQPSHVAEHAVAALPESASSLRPIINATGVVVHTNLGRASFSQAAVDADAIGPRESLEPKRIGQPCLGQPSGRDRPEQTRDVGPYVVIAWVVYSRLEILCFVVDGGAPEWKSVLDNHDTFEHLA